MKTIHKKLLFSFLIFIVSFSCCFYISFNSALATEQTVMQTVIEVDADKIIKIKNEEKKENVKKGKEEESGKTEKTTSVSDSVSPNTHIIHNVQLTAYCACDECCNTGETVKRTASGTIPRQGRTVAVDPDIIPLGSTIVINGHSFIAEDVGGAVNGNHIDVFFNEHQDALNFGVKYADSVTWH